MVYLIVIIGAYLLGSSNMAFYLSRLKKADLRSGGSGNLGASNATILLGWGAGVMVGVHDIGKAILAVLLSELLFPDTAWIGAVAGVSCVLGHIFPFYLGFKGGKGLASFLGMTIALNWKVSIFILLTLVLVTLITDYIVLGTVASVVSVPIVLGILSQSLILAAILLVASGIILWKHRENFVRIWKRTEIGLRSTIRGDHRVG